MKKWNRILAAVLTLSLTAGLTACGGSTSDATANNASAADEGTASNGSSEVYRTLDEIKESGTINIGVFSDKNPFGYVDENGEYQGYDIYFANRLGEDLGVDVNFVSTEAANRIEYLQTGKVDSLSMVNSEKSDTYHSWSHTGRWFVFASKRDDGLYGKPYFCYVDRQGKAHKPFVLPQREPTFYDDCLKSFNIPELSRGPVPFDAIDIENVMKQEAEKFK